MFTCCCCSLCGDTPRIPSVAARVNMSRSSIFSLIQAVMTLTELRTFSTTAVNRRVPPLSEVLKVTCP